MNNNEQKRVFSQNLRRLMSDRHVTQVEVAVAIGVSPTALNNWAVGVALPRINKVQALADYFGVSVYSLIEEAKPETREDRLLRVFNSRPELWPLLDVVEGMNKDEIRVSIRLLKSIKEDGYV